MAEKMAVLEISNQNAIILTIGYGVALA
jgi:7-cyano-7-deazaguanine synthase